MNSDYTPPPLPQPTSYTCPNCGFGWNEPSRFCPRCGADQTPSPQRRNGACAIMAYGCGFMVLAGLGACFTLVGAGTKNAPTFNGSTLTGVVFLFGALLLLWNWVTGGRK